MFLIFNYLYFTFHHIWRHLWPDWCTKPQNFKFTNFEIQTIFGGKNFNTRNNLSEDNDSNFRPQKLDLDWEKETIFLPFSSTSSNSKGIQHTNKSLISCFYSPDGAANHWFDQLCGDNLVCGNWFFHMTGLYSFALAAIYGITLLTQSDYSDTGLLEAIVENKANTASMYSWQVLNSTRLSIKNPSPIHFQCILQVSLEYP